MKKDLGLRCGEANPNPGTGLWGTSGQETDTETICRSQRQPRSQIGRSRKPGKKEPEKPKKSLEQPKFGKKEVLAKKEGPREPSPQAPSMGIHPPDPRHVVLWLFSLKIPRGDVDGVGEVKCP